MKDIRHYILTYLHLNTNITVYIISWISGHILYYKVNLPRINTTWEITNNYSLKLHSYGHSIPFLRQKTFPHWVNWKKEIFILLDFSCA